MISELKFRGGCYDPRSTVRFEGDGRVIITDSDFTLPAHYCKFVHSSEFSFASSQKKFSGGPFYVVNEGASPIDVDEENNASTYFSVPAGHVAVVYAGASQYFVKTYPYNSGSGRTLTMQSGRPAVLAAWQETIDTSNTCQDPIWVLTPCTTGSTKYTQDDGWDEHVGKAVYVDSVWYEVSETTILPEGESLESPNLPSAILNSCPSVACTVGAGTQFNGYIGPPTATNGNWVRLEPITHTPVSVLLKQRYCYQLWIYEGVTHDGVEYDLASASKVTAIRTSSGRISATGLLDGTWRSAYTLFYDTWNFTDGKSGAGSGGTPLDYYPYYWENVGPVGGVIGGYEIDPINPSHEFDSAQRTLIYDTMAADYGGGAPASAASHTLILYVRLNSVLPSNYDDAGVKKNNFRSPWAATTAYSLNDEIRPGAPGTTLGWWANWNDGSSPFAFRVITAGTSGGSEPTWSTATAIGDTVNDGSVVWKAVPVNYLLEQSIYLLGVHPVCYP